MKGFRFKGICVCVAAIVICITATIYYQKEHRIEAYCSYEEPLRAAPKEGNPLRYMDENYFIQGEFQTHLPIVVLEWEKEPPISTEMVYVDGMYYFAPIEGIEPYVNGKVSIYEAEDGKNNLDMEALVTTTIKIKRRGNSSMLYEKPQYLIKTVTESGEYRDVDMLGMGEEHEWILNGSMADKSMLRNYLAYSLASEFMPYTPDNKYCEVLVKTDKGFQYQGVYLLGENIRQGSNRVNISNYKERDPFNSYLVRRDRIDKADTMLDTYARMEGLAKEYFGLLYPSKKNVSKDMITYVEEDISRIEKILYSDDPKIFATYPEVIDVDSFVDYFLMHEFIGSYDSGNYSTYSYKEVGGKFTMGPIWDHDGATDNYKAEPADLDALAFQTKPLFEQLCRDNTFISKLETRYTQLRDTTFSEENVIGTIDEIIAHLGGAQEREWYRWGMIYTEDTKYSLLDYELEDGTTIIRNAKTYQDEIYRIKNLFRVHGKEIPNQLELLRVSAEFTTGMQYRREIMLFIAVCIFLLPLYYIARRR